MVGFVDRTAAFTASATNSRWGESIRYPMHDSAGFSYASRATVSCRKQLILYLAHQYKALKLIEIANKKISFQQTDFTRTLLM
jgi:hypothetical protein